MLTALVPALTGLGLFFCVIWFLARNLPQVAGTSARRLFRHAFSSHWLAALTGVLSGLLTQSTNAVALIVVSFVRSGVVPPERTPLAPTWSHVGASLLVFLVALDTGYVVAYLLALCGVALYFDLRQCRLRHQLCLSGAAGRSHRPPHPVLSGSAETGRHGGAAGAHDASGRDPDAMARGIADRRRASSGGGISGHPGAGFGRLHAGLHPLSRWLTHLAPPRHEDELAKPAFLVEEALDDPALALELAERESQRLLQRLPLMLERLRHDGDHASLTPEVYRGAGLAVGDAIRRYLAAILDRQPGHGAILRAMRLQQGTDNTIALHEALADFTRVTALASGVMQANATVSRMVEALHMLLEQWVEAVASGDAEELDISLALFGQRDELMENIRKRLLADGHDLPARVQEALFQATVLFERILWLGRDSLRVLAHPERTAPTA